MTFAACVWQLTDEKSTHARQTVLVRSYSACTIDGQTLQCSTTPWIDDGGTVSLPWGGDGLRAHTHALLVLHCLSMSFTVFHCLSLSFPSSLSLCRLLSSTVFHCLSLPSSTFYCLQLSSTVFHCLHLSSSVFSFAYITCHLWCYWVLCECLLS